jgi:hypothetical protein
VLKRIAKRIAYWLWVLNGHFGWTIRLRKSPTLTVLITYYNLNRVRHLNHQIRNLLKCDFVERIIISNHNPQFKIEQYLKVVDKRLVPVNQSTRRGCGYRWLVADQFSPEYLIVMDDDLLLAPWQLRELFTSLLSDANRPHGFAGLVQQGGGGLLQYHQRVNQSVDYLCEVYAITGNMLKQYIHLNNQIQTSPELARSIEETADFVIVSQAGDLKPRIHHATFLLRCPTFNQAGVAVHKERRFLDDVRAVASALDGIRSNQ